MINKTKNRVHEKVKDMRQHYLKAKLNGTSPGSGRIKYGNYDILVPIWVGSANSEFFNMVYKAITGRKFMTVMIIMMLMMMMMMMMVNSLAF